jgi:hypothetical protein
MTRGVAANNEIKFTRVREKRKLEEWKKMFMTNFIESKHAKNLNQLRQNQIKWKRKRNL